MNVFRNILVAATFALALPAMAQTPPASQSAGAPTASDMEILRQKVKADKRLLVNENMQLTEQEAAAFWPVYDEYQAGLAGLNERTASVVGRYADAWYKGSVPDAVASKLIEDSIAVEEDEAKLKRSILPKLAKAVGGVKAARYLQIENKVRALIRYEIAAGIPLVD